MITVRERRQERMPLMIAHTTYIPAITITNDQPQRAKPATAKATFKTQPMLIGRFENRCFLFFSAVRIIISDFFFNAMPYRSRL